MAFTVLSFAFGSKLTSAKMTQLYDNTADNKDWIGGSYTKATDHNHDSGNSAPLASGSITNAMMASNAIKVGNISKGTNGSTLFGATTSQNWVISGGNYCWMPQLKTSANRFDNLYTMQMLNGAGDGAGSPAIVTTGMQPFLYISTSGAVSKTITWEGKYVSASGDEKWAYILYDNELDQIRSVWFSDDHPSYGGGMLETELTHPFGTILPHQDVILVDNDVMKDVEAMQTRNLTRQEILHFHYKFDISPIKPKFKDRAIIEIDWYGDQGGEKIKTIDNEKGIDLKRRVVTKVPDGVELRRMVKK